MPRFRRYRAFVFGAALFLFLLFRLSQNAQSDANNTTIYRGYSPPASEPGSESGSSSSSDAGAGPDVAAPYRDTADVKAAQSAEWVAPAIETLARLPDLHTSLEIKGSYGLPTGHHSHQPAGPQQTDPPAAPAQDSTADSERVHMVNPPGALQETVAPVAADATAAAQEPFFSTSTIHWMKMAEHFPIPEESLIILPTGSPRPIPRIQYLFESESDSAREIRESRLASVRGEMQHAWSGYRTYAWTHDELAPNTKGFKDPFCGWAASLVDGLDTLWIMDMYAEFDEAYEAVKQIDFTTTPFRSEIPVFETIIRYLGGLIAAYDISGGPAGKYPVLLTKAVDLAEILMGVFDTPNRMPILYYNWKPAFFSQPKAASSSVSVAELGSMTMEFTRLAQLTGHHKYYDAIARIIDAFEEWQNREGGTALPGIFPENIDASGCNRTTAALQEAENASRLAKSQMAAAEDIDSEPVGYQPSQPDADAMVAEDKVKLAKTMPPDLEFRVNPASSPDQPATGEFHAVNKRDLPVDSSPDVEKNNTSDASSDSAASASDAEGSAQAAVPSNPVVKTSTGLRHSHIPKQVPIQSNGEPAEFQCIPQNLTTGGYGMDSYGMGGSQDSTYEYFPKQYLLLGGLVPKYRTMHEKVTEAVKKYLLYRPMIKDDRDILFSAKVSSRDRTDKDLAYQYEITHLTCFLGGMFAMGGRIFDRPEDVEIGSKLADGCVWAYEAMPMGIMPEGATIVPCSNMTHCTWNETAWHEKLDPNVSWRVEQMRDYEVRMQEWTRKKDEIRQLQQQRIEEKERERQAAANAELANNSSSPDSAESARSAPETADGAANIGKRDVDAGEEPTAAETAAIDRKAKSIEGDLDLNGAGGKEGGDWRDAAAAQSNEVSTPPSTPPAPDNGRHPVPESQKPLVDDLVTPPMPRRPESHEEFVQHRIEQDKLPPGFTSVNFRRYILRPEAIESVWYMYRITGNPEWQEKGWRMFQAVIKATKTEVGHSAIADVTADPNAEPEQLDGMESFWFAETLKYFYLLFAKPDVISLDDYVLNTEAHPFKRPT